MKGRGRKAKGTASANVTPDALAQDTTPAAPNPAPSLSSRKATAKSKGKTAPAKQASGKLSKIVKLKSRKGQCSKCYSFPIANFYHISQRPHRIHAYPGIEIEWPERTYLPTPAPSELEISIKPKPKEPKPPRIRPQPTLDSRDLPNLPKTPRSTLPAKLTLLNLPVEFRHRIYSNFLVRDPRYELTETLEELEGLAKHRHRLDFLRTCSQIYLEAQPIALASTGFYIRAPVMEINQSLNTKSKKRKAGKQDRPAKAAKKRKTKKNAWDGDDDDEEKLQKQAEEEKEIDKAVEKCGWRYHQAPPSRKDLFVLNRFNIIGPTVTKFVKHLAYSMPVSRDHRYVRFTKYVGDFTEEDYHKGKLLQQELDWIPFGVNLTLIPGGIELETLTLWTNGSLLAAWFMHAAIDSFTLKRVNILVMNQAYDVVTKVGVGANAKTFRTQEFLALPALREALGKSLSELVKKNWIKDRDTDKELWSYQGYKGGVASVVEEEIGRRVEIMVGSIDEVVRFNVGLGV
ncbi:hypothetical protein EJ08DRAFT_660387 [Tothia fuscella]|uniref:Uncharacterized protein n=1 Tax=Tothia fuscella TaxID=1048955 RepID=A0A9P4NRV0_9PEZI|nr:hypothetical protein EJ08DRAFT_660387 [Tothia fuscella]